METECRQKAPYKEILDGRGIIVPKLAGGLGNMMFQIAASYSFAKEVGSKFAIDYQHIGTLHGHPTNYRLSTFKNIPEIEGLSSSALLFKEGQYNYEAINTGGFINKELYIDGYYQSYKYFEKHIDDIISLFSPNVTEMGAMNNIYGHLFDKETVSIHVRRGDYENLSDYHVNLPASYYLDAMACFDTNVRFIVFSDDIEWCKKKITLLNTDVEFITDEPDWMDLYLMTWCNHNIIANSTFSWWGAFLNTNKNKKVVIPDQWFGPSQPSTVNTRDLFPKEWKTVNELSSNN